MATARRVVSRAPATPVLRRNLQFLTRLDLVGIAELVAIGVEDLPIRIRITEKVLGDFAQGVACFDRVGTVLVLKSEFFNVVK